MMGRNVRIVKNPVVFCLLMLAALLVINSYAQLFLAEMPGGHPPGQAAFSVGAFLGELAPIVADYLVIEAHHVWHTGRWYMMPAIYSMIVNVEPSYIDYWSLLAWLYAFNNSVYMNDDPVKRETVIDKGIEVARTGLLYHGQRYELYFDIGWIYFKKKHDYRRAVMYLNRARQFSHPIKVERLLSIALYRSQGKEAAVAVWEEYLREHPDDAAALRECARLDGLVP